MGHILSMILQRLALGLVTLFVVSVIIFLGTELLPGDFAQEILGQSATPETVAALRERLGLNDPMHIRYIGWLTDILQGDFGESLANGQSVSDLIGRRLGNTLRLAAYAAAIAVPLSLTLGILAALFRNTFFDRFANASALTSISFPEFFVAYILIFFLAGAGGIFPSMANLPAAPAWPDVPDYEIASNIFARIGIFFERLKTYFSDLGAYLPNFFYRAFLPALTLTLVVTAHMMRMTRAAIINLLASPYIEMARLKGMKPMRIILKHALPNALAPIINVVALNLAYLITGVVVVEVVFVYPGLGQLMVDSVAARDMPVVQGVALIFAAAYVLLNLTADVLATLSNPRLVHRR